MDRAWANVEEKEETQELTFKISFEFNSLNGFVFTMLLRKRWYLWSSKAWRHFSRWNDE